VEQRGERKRQELMETAKEIKRLEAKLELVELELRQFNKPKGLTNLLGQNNCFLNSKLLNTSFNK
jgi:hypothetical protein